LTESRYPDEDRSDEAIAEEQPADEQVAQEQEYDRFAEDVGRDDRGEDYDEPAPELGDLHRDYSIPGVDSKESNPYRWHTGEKRDHGGEDAIEVIDLVKQFGRTRILNGLNLGLPDNQISMVLGPSGTGKSVLIKHIVGLLYPDTGDLLVHGESVPNMTDDELFEMRKKFGLLFQDGALFGSMNVYDNTAFPLRQHTDKGEDEIGEIVNRRLREVGLAEATEKMPNELSGGCYLVISHDLGTARRIADFIAVLWKGRIVESGPSEELFNSENEFVSQFLNAQTEGPLAMD
jgi:phospholipid/cholesterol/gamma-HCH transport system ATP-binding protein